jgi:AraC family transcriptional regulator, positive regulator of tynA and feaB
MRQWTTEDRRPNEQYGYWREVICQAYTIVDSQARTRDSFESTVVSSECGGLTITRTRSKAQTVLRGNRELRKRMAEEFYVILQLNGNLRVEQGGREALIRPGEFVMIDAAERYRLDWEDWNVLCFAVPHQRIVPLLRQAHSSTAIRQVTADGVGYLARNYMLSLRDSAESLDRPAQDVATAHLVNLIALGLDPVAGFAEVGASSVAKGLKVALDQYIDSHLSDPGLTVTMAADRFHVSPRTLHRQFEEGGTSFTQTVLEKRLARAADLIVDPAHAYLVSEVAYRSGFNDLSYFCRMFKRRFGVSPREYRKIGPITG